MPVGLDGRNRLADDGEPGGKAPRSPADGELGGDAPGLPGGGKPGDTAPGLPDDGEPGGKAPGLPGSEELGDDAPGLTLVLLAIMKAVSASVLWKTVPTKALKWQFPLL